MYEAYWGLKDKPFRNTPDPRYFYYARAHEEALTRAFYALAEGQGAMLLTGEVGCGKTLVVRTLLDALDPSRFEAAFVAFPNLSPDDFLRELLRQFGYAPEGWDRSALRRGLERFLDGAARRGLSAVVVVDEAQTVADPLTWEEIRMLLNYQQDRRFGLTLFLAGQPELRATVASQPPLAGRLGVHCHLGALAEDEARAYLAHRMAVAGGSVEAFADEARALLARASGGVARRLNHLADLALLAGFGGRARQVDAALVRTVLPEAMPPAAVERPEPAAVSS